MSVGLSKTKHRITSVKSTEKITKAMELISTVRLKKLLSASSKERLYSREFESLMGELFAHDSGTASHYGRPNEGDLPNLFICISSDLGLCGGYNNEVFKWVSKCAKPTDVIAPLGLKATHHYANDDTYKNIDHDFEKLSLASLDLDSIQKLCLGLKDDFNARKYARIYVIFTRYVNSITFTPIRFQLLPVQIKQEKWPGEEYCPPLFDEAPRHLIHHFMSEYLASVFYDRLLDSQLSEQASRRTAMDNANDNADEILGKLQIEYNKARQNAITQEITEVVGGANAS
ncbi:MAG: ATP synthase F1 subunit gamma [Bacilli bacterium]|jgi:F-type H+-transporting ATPase subunit gamma|nr:ATP synthase F1 subunit gamma [Bacilli bacterium]